MSDNVAITPGSGATIASDDVSGVQYQRVKLDVGGDGASVPVTSAAPLPVETTTTKTVKWAAISAASSGNNTLVAAVAGKKITVLGYVIVADGAVAAKFTDGAGGTDLTGAMSLAANGGVSARSEMNAPMLQGGTNTALVLNLSAAVGVRGHMTYIEV